MYYLFFYGFLVFHVSRILRILCNSRISRILLFPAFQKIVLFKLTKLTKAVRGFDAVFGPTAADLEMPDVTYVEEIKNGPISSVKMYHTDLTSKHCTKRCGMQLFFIP